jgi:hypothetical protein
LWEIAALISAHTIDGKRARRADAKTKAFAGAMRGAIRAGDRAAPKIR